MKRFKALLIGAVLGTAVCLSFPTALASAASPSASTASPAKAEPAAKVEAVAPQVNSPESVSPQAAPALTAEQVLEEAPVIPDLSLFGKILAWVVAVNLLLGGLAAGLAKVKDITATKADDNLYDIISKVAGFLGKVLDMATANSRPKSKE